MESITPTSTDSMDSILRNECEEVVVDSTSTALEGKADIATVVIASSNPQLGEPASDSEDESDEEVESSSSASKLSNESENKNLTEEQKIANLKLVLKKSPEYQLVNPSSAHGKNCPNTKIFLATVVSNTGSANAKYSITTPVEAKSAANRSSETTEQSAAASEDESSKLEVLKLSDQSKPVKTYGRTTTTTTMSSIEENLDQSDLDKTEDISKEDFEKSESDSKQNTPKIGRELQQLQKTVNESKVLSGFMSDSMGKSRKARKTMSLKGSDAEGSPMVTGARSRSRSRSKPRIDSPIDGDQKLRRWPSEEKILKRQNMRSQNSEFIQKHMKFLNSVQGDEATDNSDGETSITDGKSSSHSNNDSLQQITSAKRELYAPPKSGWDMFCFKCHSGLELMPCSKCIRSFHAKCVRNSSPSKTWICPECTAIESSINSTSRSKTHHSIENLNQLLQFALKRMMQLKGSEQFLTEFHDEEFPEITKYIVNPVTLEKLQKSIEEKKYKCTEEFAVDAKCILHNCSVYFGNNSKISNCAKGIVKVCRQEVTEIDTCPECYYNANTRKDWFIEVCSKPHMLLWAKLKGFPYWPAKAMGNNGTLVNVRFFGDHDRAYVPIKECFLYSEDDPNPPTKNKKSIRECIKEVDIHIRKITAKFGSFVYPPFRTVYDPNNELDQLEMMIPGIRDNINNAVKSSKPALTYKIIKTADNHLSIIKKDKKTTEEVVNSSSPVVDIGADNVPDDNNIAKSADDKVSSKQRVQSTDSSQSNNEVSSTCELGIKSSTNDKNLSESTSPEKTVSPVKIQERPIPPQSMTKTYEVVNKVNDQEQTKVNSVILKRKSDNWNAVTSSIAKKHKIGTEKAESTAAVVLEPNNPSTSSSENDERVVVNGSQSTEPIVTTLKRKRSREEPPPKAQKQMLDEDKIPPLVLLTQPIVITPAKQHFTSQVPTTSAVTTSLPISTSLNSTVTVTITQSPVVTSASVKGNVVQGNSRSATSNTILEFENSEISIKRITKNPVVLQKQASPSSQPSPSLNKEKTTARATENKAPAAAKTTSIITASFVDDTPNSSDKNKRSSNNSNGESKNTSDLIPLVEIKTEKPDAVETSTDLVEIHSEPAISQPETGSNLNSNANPSELGRTTVVIKTELTSDDEEMSIVSGPQENGAAEKSLGAKQVETRTSAKSTVQIQPLGSKVTKPEIKKQRARKSFPNRGTFNPVAVAPNINSNLPAVKRAIMPQPLLSQNTSMVYIPVDASGSPTSIRNQTTTTTASTSVVAKSLASTIPPSTSSNTVMLNIGAGLNAVNNSLTQQLPSTILTTSLQLPIVYSTIPISSAVSTPAISQSNAVVSIQGSCMSTSGGSVSTGEKHMLSGFVTPNLASAITDAIVKGPPKLAPRPSGALRSEGDYVFPSEAGPVSKMLMENAHKMTDFFRSVIEDTLNDMANNRNLQAKVRLLEVDLEKMKHAHEKEMAELKHNTDLMLCEMRKSLENEKARLIAETRKQCELERIRAVEEAKTKQWCAACGKEAQFYCCWNTSYCDYPCQEKHWSRHMNSCAQKDNADANAQRIGVKISPFNVKDKKTNKPNPTAVVARPVSSPPVKHLPNPARSPNPPMKRWVPITTQASTRYTLINSNEGNWGLVPTAPFPTVFPTSSLIMSVDGTKNKPTPPQCPINMLRTPKM